MAIADAKEIFTVNTFKGFYRNRDQDVYNFIAANQGATFTDIYSDVSTPNAQETELILPVLETLGMLTSMSDYSANEIRWWTTGGNTGYANLFLTHLPTALAWIDDPLNDGKTEVDLGEAVGIYAPLDPRNECWGRVFAHYFELEESAKRVNPG